jgi:hypothetical protein
MYGRFKYFSAVFYLNFNFSTIKIILGIKISCFYKSSFHENEQSVFSFLLHLACAIHRFYDRKCEKSQIEKKLLRIAWIVAKKPLKRFAKLLWRICSKKPVTIAEK